MTSEEILTPKAKATVLGSDKATASDKEKIKENCLYIRYRNRKLPSREEIRKLHRKIVDVRLPRQKNAKFCHLEFETKEEACKALTEIKTKHSKDVVAKSFSTQSKTLLKKSEISVKPSNDKKSSEDRDSSNEASVKVLNSSSSTCLHVCGLPVMATDQILQNLFAKSTQVTVGKKLIKGKRFGLVHFGSVEDTTEAMENSNGISVNGEVLEVKFHECHS